MDENLYHEYLDKYFLNQLSEREKISFEQLVNQDPVKSEEFAFQKKVIEGIQHFRKAQIKQHLNRIPEPQSASYPLPTLAWLSTGVAATLLIFTLGFLLWKNTQPKMLLDEGKAKASTSTVPPSLPEISKVEPQTKPALIQEEEPRKAVLSKTAPLSPPSSSFQLAKVPSMTRPAILPLLDKNENHKRQVFQHLKPHEMTSSDSEHKKDFEGIVSGETEETLEEMAASNQLSVQSYNNKVFVYNNRAGSTGQICVLAEGDAAPRTFYYENGKYYETPADQVSLNKPRPVTDLRLIEKLEAIRKLNF
ncbi:MAG: hypothetical protein OHK0053_17450 [Microscillaceae bacterium]